MRAVTQRTKQLANLSVIIVQGARIPYYRHKMIFKVVHLYYKMLIVQPLIVTKTLLVHLNVLLKSHQCHLKKSFAPMIKRSYPTNKETIIKTLRCSVRGQTLLSKASFPQILRKIKFAWFERFSFCPGLVDWMSDLSP